jgi:glycosyltransferase involved in cell wall biosynthesis
MRLGVYSDLTYRKDGSTLSNNRAFIRFVTSLPPRVDEVVLFGRLDPEPGRSPYVLPSEGVRLVPLPYYRRAVALGQLLRAVRGSCRAFAAELEHVDAVWIFGPQPLAMLFAWIARRRGVPLVLGVRHDYPEYIANRLPSPRWRWAIPVAHAMDLAFRAFARRAPTVALGRELARRYEGGEAPVITTGFSLVPRAELRPLDAALGVPWNADRTVLTVSRLDAEKNPLLLLDVIRTLRAKDPRWRLRVAGDGPLRGELERRAAEAGLNGAVELLGEVPNGPELWQLYRTSQAFLHVSFTEGLPQVLFEAQAAGLPIVATAVGGVSEALGGGKTGLLIPPADAGAAVAALERLADDEELRRGLCAAGLANAEHETLEAQLDRLAAFFREAVSAA